MSCGKLRSRVPSHGRERLLHGIDPVFINGGNRQSAVFGPGGCAITPVTRTFRFHGSGQIIRERDMKNEVYRDDR